MSEPAPVNDYTVEETLWRRVLTAMEDYRESGQPEHLRDAHRVLGTWVHFCELVEQGLR